MVSVIQGGDYTHTFVSAKTGAVKVTGGGNITPTNATYDGGTRELVNSKIISWFNGCKYSRNYY